VARGGGHWASLRLPAIPCPGDTRQPGDTVTWHGDAESRENRADSVDAERGNRNLIIDTHVHVVSGDRSRYPVLPKAPDWPITEVEALVVDMDALQIERALLVQTFFTYGTDNRYVIDAAARYPGRLQTVCVIDQTAADAPDTLSDLVENHAVRGVRLMPKGHPPGVLSNPLTFPVWRRAIELGIPILVSAELEHLPEMLTVVERFPEATVCFEHMWGLELGDPPYRRVSAIFELARYPNVRLKLCPNNSFAAREGSGSPKQFFGTLVERFGVERLMWGSNYPAHAARFGTLQDRLRVMQQDFSFLGDEASRCFFSEAALRVWPSLR
jgi:L-fuconolactonase